MDPESPPLLQPLTTPATNDLAEEIRESGRVVFDLLCRAQCSPEAWPLLNASANVRQLADRPEALPVAGMPLSEVLNEAGAFMENGMCNVSHPRYFGYISPKPHPATVLGDFLGSSLNQTPGAWRAGPSATAIEIQVLHWLRELFALPPAVGQLPGGIFTGGGTLANLIALKLARDRVVGAEVRNKGLSSEQLRVYMSVEGHFSIGKAMDTLGLGTDNLVLIPTNELGVIDVDELEAHVSHDQAAGLKPLCIVGMAGTTASGAIDPLNRLAELSARCGAWFHVDGASGLAMAALPAQRLAMSGLEAADSITFDPCKWMFAPFGVGCLLVRDGTALGEAFWSEGHYWEEQGELDTFKMNLYGTRQFRSLGLWCFLRNVGAEGYRGYLVGLLHCAQAFRDAVAADTRYELLPQQTHMPIVCFRVAAEQEEESQLLTRRLVQTCLERDIAYPTVLEWRGQTFVRLAISNYATTLDDMGAVKAAMDAIMRELSPGY
ncbi:pyridoxal phosphate-dependent decarboxylase family protein [Allohahella sp. A8]|uniref:pyridoxal phosphate-dependent decarboxylase family protein n=1 Tax=Allohahella sp. A8 TaxID=3141461 RepID=UPI003A7FA352